MAKRKSAKKIQQERELYTWFTVIIVVALLIIAYMKTGLVGSFLNHLFCFIFGEFLTWIKPSLLVGELRD